jgi:hypothetical protein
VRKKEKNGRLPVVTQAEVRALKDDELKQVKAWAVDEEKAREERHKQETIAKIRELAGSIDVPVRIGTRGRPPKARENGQKKA